MFAFVVVLDAVVEPLLLVDPLVTAPLLPIWLNANPNALLVLTLIVAELTFAAHDTEANMPIDMVFDVEKKEIRLLLFAAVPVLWRENSMIVCVEPN